METNHKFIDLLRLLADSHEHPDPDSSPLSAITDLGNQAVPLLIEALTHDDPIIRRTAAETLGQLRFTCGQTVWICNQPFHTSKQ